MAEYDKVEKVESVRSKRKAQEVAKPEDYAARAQPNKEHFESLLNAQKTTVQRNEVTEKELKKTQLMEQVREVGGRVDTLKRLTPEEIVAQTKDVISEVDKIKKKLQTPDLRISPADQALMESKLSHIDDKLRVAVEKTGGEYTTLEVREARSSFQNPIERFLGFLENGESQLQNIGNQVYKISQNRGTLSPADLLLVQVKVGFVQQQLEFFTSLLNKSLESTKTLLNVQV